MKSVASIFVGLIAGWFLTRPDYLIPDAVTDWIGNAVAGSGTISASLKLLPLSPDTVYSMHVFIIALSILAVPVFVISLVATGVYLWSRKARLIVYYSLVAPLFMAATASYYKYQLEEYDHQLARSFWNNAEGNVQVYIWSACLFVLTFAALKITCSKLVDAD